ncbi:hypothetical protein DM01DRAFT_347075 [Hesseltinella vesiculosa]|uniref:Uncharacterized protein n=1 Tax=Hesseltinella vesiculosa TaxID=101127 RepID=A0A1X2G2K6_9FUNG|nr:hypothetical protein DM01DRAFT_347075 [Hesseltinella vesiculosa]
MVYIRDVFKVLGEISCLGKLTITRPLRLRVTATAIFPLDDLLRYLPQLTRFTLTCCTVVIVSNIPNLHSLSHLCLDSCFLPEKLLEDGFLDLPTLKTLRLVNFSICSSRTIQDFKLPSDDEEEEDGIDIIIPMALPPGLELTAILRSAQIASEFRLGHFQYISFTPSFDDHEPVVWEISSENDAYRLPCDLAKRVASVQKGKCERDGTARIYKFHLKVVSANIKSFRVYGRNLI